MNDGMNRCAHGHSTREVPRLDLGPGWVQPIAEGCFLCLEFPDRQRLPYLTGLAELAFKIAAAQEIVRANTVPDPDNWIRVSLSPADPERSARLAQMTAALGAPPAEVHDDCAVWYAEKSS